MVHKIFPNLQNELMAIIITLTVAVIISMLIGYRIIAIQLVQRGMKKGDAKAIGQATASLLFLLIAAIYFKLFIFG